MGTLDLKVQRSEELAGPQPFGGPDLAFRRAGPLGPAYFPASILRRLAHVRHPARLSNRAYVGRAPIFLTIGTWDRRPHFLERALVSLVVDHLRVASLDCAFAIVVYCFMPDHLHALVAGTSDDANFRNFVRLAKQRTSFHARRIIRGRLWQQSFFDRTLRVDDVLHETIRYIVMNPVRAGLAATPLDYDFWGSAIYSPDALLEYIGKDKGRWT
jgi:REP element-mobilizing transposase RayT